VKSLPGDQRRPLRSAPAVVGIARGDLIGPLGIISVFMNIITWNVRGLGRPAKRFLVKDFLLLHCAEVCCLQESKLPDLPALTWREIGGPVLDCSAFLPARGSSGGDDHWMEQLSFRGEGDFLWTFLSFG